MRLDPSLWSDEPARRLSAARAAGRFATRSLAKRAGDWPANSPAALNAWLLFVTTKEPIWRDALVEWPAGPPTLGEPHPGFFYPDPLGFWAEVRRWALELLRIVEPSWTQSEALSVTSVAHLGHDVNLVLRARTLMRPRIVVHLDETSAASAAASADTRERFSVPDPHRDGQYYEGWWGVEADGTVVGKAPQHPAAQRLYRHDDLTEFLRHAPLD